MRILRRPHAHPLGQRLDDHAEHHQLHQPHAPARGAGELAGGADGAAAAAPHADHLRDQRPPPSGGPREARRQRCAARLAVADRRGARPAGPHGPARLRRLAQGQRRLGAPHRADEGDRVQRPPPPLPGPHQQQDQRHHDAALAHAGEPRPHRSPRRGDRPRVPRRSRPPCRAQRRWPTMRPSRGVSPPSSGPTRCSSPD